MFLATGAKEGGKRGRGTDFADIKGKIDLCPLYLGKMFMFKIEVNVLVAPSCSINMES